MISKGSRRKDIDIIYSIGAILAVFGHSHPNNWAAFEGTIFYHLIVFIYTFHMPLFFVVAGILLVNSNSVKSKSFLSFMKEKAVKLLVPYFVLSLVFVLPKGYLEFGNFSFLNLGFLVETLFSPRDNVWGHFWFLPTLFICYVVFAAIWKIALKTEQNVKACILVAVSLLFLALYFMPVRTDWFSLKDVSTSAFYMAFGMMIAYVESRVEFSVNNKIKLIVFAALAILSVLFYVWLYSSIAARFAMSLLMIAAIMLIARVIGKKGESLFYYISKNVFSIYIYSWIFQSFTLVILEKFGVSWVVMAPIMFVIGIGGPIILAFIYKKLKKINCKFFDLILGIR